MPLTPIEALNKVVEDRVAKAKLTGFRTLANLAEKGRISTVRKTNLDWDVEVGGAAAAWEAVTANGSATATDDVVPANLRVGTHRVKHQFNISKIAMQEAAVLAPEELANLLGAHTDRAVNAIMRKINIALYQGDGTAAFGNVIGLETVANNTLVYAGISPVTYPSWSALRNTNATPRAFTRDIMLDVDQLVAEQESMYDFVATTPALSKSYVKVFDTLAGNQSVMQSPEDGKTLPSVDLGHSGRYYNGYPIVEDPQATAGSIWLLNMMDVTLHCFELGINPEGLGQHSINSSYGLPIHIAELPSSNSAVRTFEFFVLPQLQVYNRKSVIRIDQLT